MLINFIIKPLLLLLPIINNHQDNRPSMQIDSISVLTMPNNDSNFYSIFSKIYEYQIEKHLYERTDSINYDYGFIESQFKDSLLNTIEYYYKKESKMPYKVFYNGNLMDSTIYYYNTNIKELQKNFKPSKSFQELNYSKIQVIFTGCITRANKIYKENRTNRLKKTYQVQTMINKSNNLITVSFQRPPKKPHFKMKFEGLSF